MSRPFKRMVKPDIKLLELIAFMKEEELLNHFYNVGFDNCKDFANICFEFISTPSYFDRWNAFFHLGSSYGLLL